MDGLTHLNVGGGATRLVVRSPHSVTVSTVLLPSLVIHHGSIWNVKLLMTAGKHLIVMYHTAIRDPGEQIKERQFVPLLMRPQFYF